MWTAGPLCIFWTVWNARNGIVFRDEVLSIQKLKSSFVNPLFFRNQVVYRGWSNDLGSIH